MKPWKVVLLFAHFSACLLASAEFRGRRCEFLTSARNAVVKWAGNVSGTVQYCANTHCCMGFFKMVNGKPVPDQLGCDVFQTRCPDPTCSISVRQENFVGCVCSSDFCNANITWSLEPSHTERRPALDLGDSVFAVIPLGILLGFFTLCVVIRYGDLFKAWVQGHSELRADSREHRIQGRRTEPGWDASPSPMCRHALSCQCSDTDSLNVRCGHSHDGENQQFYENSPSTHEGPMMERCSCNMPGASDMDLANLELQQMVASGHFASVWQGRLNGDVVAVKVFPVAQQRSFAKEREVFGLPLMEHPGLVLFLGAGMERTEGHWVLLLEMAKYGSLKTFLSSNTRDWVSSLKLAHTLSQGLAYLHTDLYRNGLHKPAIAHCDLSSSNVLVRTDGTCALCDFGCATVLRSCPGQLRWQQQRENAQLRSQVGTLRYVSPEVLEGCVNLNSDRCLIQADVYALGLLLWELWMRCSDLYTESPAPEHQLPYEAELGPSPSLNDLILFVSERRERPILPKSWEQFTQGFSAMKEILEDCWDHEPEARLTAQCLANRVAGLPQHCG